MDRRYKLRKVLARDQYARPLLTMARFVPWGIQPEEGIGKTALARYLGKDPKDFHHLMRKLGIRGYWEAPADHGRYTRGQRMLVSEQDAARIIVHVRAREGARLLRDQERARPPAPSPAAPPGGSTDE